MAEFHKKVLSNGLTILYEHRNLPVTTIVVAAKYGYIDDVIEPRNTRFRIIRALQMLATKKDVNPPKKHSNLPL